MAKKDDYREYAAEALRLASSANSTADKSRLLAIAERWLDLADRADHLIRQQTLKYRKRSSSTLAETA